MKYRMFASAALTLSVASLAVSTAAAAGGRFHSRTAVGQPAIGVHATARPIIPLGPSNLPFTRARSHGRIISPGVPIVIAAPHVLYGEAPPTYFDQPASVAPPISSVVPPVPPEPEVVQYSAGRYELRGDGLTTPYRWVWIPNPPSAPPSKSTGDARDTPLYGWVDRAGVMHVTDRLQAIPPEYREQAKRNRAL